MITVLLKCLCCCLWFIFIVIVVRLMCCFAASLLVLDLYIVLIKFDDHNVHYVSSGLRHLSIC